MAPHSQRVEGCQNVDSTRWAFLQERQRPRLRTVWVCSAVFMSRKIDDGRRLVK
jgi:hypothetical protein